MEKIEAIISDAVIFERKIEKGDWVILRENDHLLRRFGQIDLIQLNADSHGLKYWRESADELWTVIRGEATFQLQDKRQESPSFERGTEVLLCDNHPQILLVPFGVECVISSRIDAQMIRVTTHQDDTLVGDIIARELNE